MKKIVVAILILFLVGCESKSNIAKDIVSNVEKAYDKASMYGYPTLEQVKSSFYMSDASWLGDQVISNKQYVCDIKVENNNLKVKCPNMESNKAMPLAN